VECELCGWWNGVPFMTAPSQSAAVRVVLDADDPLPPEDRASPEPRPSLNGLYRTQAPRLLSFFARRADRQDAADLLQDSFVRILRTDQTRVSPLAEPAAYLTQVAKNLLRNRARSAFYRSVVAGEASATMAASVDPTAQIEARDDLRRLEAALLKLKPKTREILLAHRLDGATYNEIAAMHGLSVKGVEWHMSKAIAQIQRLVDRS